MSYTIEYNRKCLKLDEGAVIGNWRSAFGATYFLFAQQGDNNVRPRPRTWELIASGSHEKVLSVVRRRAEACAGGDLQTGSGYIEPGDYITRHAKALGAAKPMTLEALRGGLGIHALIYTFLDPKMIGSLDEFHRGRLAEVEALFDKELVCNRYLEYSIGLRSLEDFMLWVNNHSLAASLQGIPAIRSVLNR